MNNNSSENNNEFNTGKQAYFDSESFIITENAWDLNNYFDIYNN